MTTEKPSPDLAQTIIAAEYGYVAQTAFQANEDRARAWQYFFVTFATLIAALLSTQVEGCLLYTSPSPRDGLLSRMPSSA